MLRIFDIISPSLAVASSMIHPDWKRTVPLPPTVRLVWDEFGPSPRQVPTEAMYASLSFPVGLGGLPYLVANMVMTQNGEAALGGKAVTIGTALDALVLSRLRSAVDAVLTGSGTLLHDDVTAVLPASEASRRTESGRSPRLLVVVAASSLSFDQEIFARRFFSDPRFDKLMVTGPKATREQIRAMEDRGVEVLRVPASGEDGRPSIPAALEALRARGVRTMVCEGGPRFLASLLAAQAVREYFLTTSPLLTGDPDVPRPVFGVVTDTGAPVLLSRVSRYEHDFHDPVTGARLVEAFDRFRIVYPP